MDDFGFVQKEKAGRGRKGGCAQEYFENSGMDLGNIYQMCQLEVWYFQKKKKIGLFTKCGVIGS